MKHLITLTNGKTIECGTYIESSRLSGFLCVGDEELTSEHAHKGQSQLINMNHVVAIREATEDDKAFAKFFFV